MTGVSEMLGTGWALVPIPTGQKGPVHKGWNMQSQCITNTARLHLLEGMNVGLAHAYCTPSPTCAIDIDNYKAAKPWLATHCIKLNDLLEAPDAVVIWSGKKYSLKLVYTLPAGVAPMVSTKINGSDGRVALEFRCATSDGKTVQDVLPPSIHPSGSPYQWLGRGNPLALPEIAEDLLNLWRTLVVNGSRVANRKFALDLGGSMRLESPRQIATIKDALSHITADCSYEVWRNIVWAILSTRWTCAEAIAQAWSQSAPDRYAEDAFWTLVNSFMPQRGNQITVGTIYHHARLGGWRG
jgi:putative DNA primase/helicase